VIDAVRVWRASVLDAMTRVPRRSTAALALVRATAGDGGVPSINAEHAEHESETPKHDHHHRP
jgi:hypothetical protein